jgi:hypothetical protein
VRTYPTPATSRIEQIGIDQIADWIADGKGLRWIAEQIGTSAMSLSRWLSADVIRSARVSEAQIVGADMFEHQAIEHLQMAEQAIRAEPQISSAIVALARERAQAAWRQASVRDPRRYSDKRTSDVNVNITHDVRQISTQELERLVAQQRDTLQLGHDGEVTEPAE